MTSTETMTVQQAALTLGVSRPTVYRMIERGRLVPLIHPVTGRTRLYCGEVQRLLSSGLPTPDGVRREPAPGRHMEPPSHVVASIFNAPELALDFGVPDLSDRVDYYRSHGLPDDA